MESKARRLLPFRFRGLLVPATFALLAACTGSPSKTSHRWFGMDTDFSATLYSHGKTLAKEDSAFALLERETARLESVFSDYLPGSSLNRLLGRAGDTLDTDAEIMEVFRSAEEMAVASHGRFDITLHNLKTAWGLASGDTNRIPTDSALAEAMRGNPAFAAPPDSNPSLHPPFRLIGGNRLVLLRDSVVFDLGGIAKGYAVDRMHAMLDSLGYPNHIVTAGGDLRVGGRKTGGPWILGIRHPRHPDGLAGNLTLSDPMAISTSGDYERFFIRDGVRYHHIFDPRTGKPAHPYCSVTVLASGSLLADRLTKPLFLMGPEQGADLLKRFGAKAVWMREIDAGGNGEPGVGKDAEGAPRLCYVASEGLEGILKMKDVASCAQGK